jgi:DNA-binding NtrC family response regulator
MGVEGRQTILVLDDDTSFLAKMRLMLVSNNIKDVVAIDKSGELMGLLEQREFAALLMDWVMPGVGGMELLPVIVERYPDMPVIIMTGIIDAQQIVDCIKQGAFDYITKPVDPIRLLSCLDKARQFNEISRQNRRLKKYLMGNSLLHPEVFSGIITSNPQMQAIFKIIEAMSTSGNPVMITGETGVGKELIARAIHQVSGVTGEFVALNAAGCDDQMFADALFGHRKGAFTGAHENREGLIAKAKGGTLFLDEIGDLRSTSQVKLLRLLQEGEYYRLGSDALFRSDARIIAASNADFSTLLSQGRFRRDLYHRLRSHHIHVPPLRERAEDIPLLIDHFLQESSLSLGRPVPPLSREARDVLESYRYPGNVRELMNLVHHAVACHNGNTLSLDDFSGIGCQPPPDTREFRILRERQFHLHAVFPSFPSLESIEKLIIDEALCLSKGNKSIAADLLGIARSTLHRKLSGVETEKQDGK